MLTTDSLSVYKDKKIDKVIIHHISSKYTRELQLMPHLHFQNNQLSFEEVPPIILSESGVELADDYTKRKHVFRLKTHSASEVLFQAENDTHLSQWIEKLEPLAASVGQSQSQASQPSSTSTGRKLTSVRNRSPTGQSPATKNRKPSAGTKTQNANVFFSQVTIKVS